MWNTFDQVAGDPFFWWKMGDDLMVAASVLLEVQAESSAAYFGSLPAEGGWIRLTDEQQHLCSRLGIGRVFYFLAGLAFENRIKGILVARNRDLAAGGRLSKYLTGRHNLQELFQQMNFTLSADEKNLVERLSETVVWAGRYPVPKRESDRAPRLIPGKGQTYPGTFSSEEDELIFDLWGRLREVIMNDPMCPKYKSIGPEGEVAPNTGPQADG